MNDTCTKELRKEVISICEKHRITESLNFTGVNFEDEMAEFVKRKITEELYNVGNCAVDCGSTEMMDYVDYRLAQLNHTEGRRNLEMLVGEPDINLNCKQVAKEFGCCMSIGRYGLKLFPKDPNGKTYKLFQIIPLDGWITDHKEIIESFANDQDFKISYRKNNVYKGDNNENNTRSN